MASRYYISEEINGRKFALVIIHDEREMSQVFYNKNGHFSMKASFERDADKVSDFIRKPQIGSMKFEEFTEFSIFNEPLNQAMFLANKMQQMFH